MKIVWSLHLGPFPSLTPDQTARLVQDVGAQTCTVVVAKEGQVSLENIYPELPDFINALSRAGVETYSVDLPLNLEQLLGEPDFLKLLSACGVREATIPAIPKKGYFVRSRLTKAREALDALAPHLESNKLKLVLPVVGASLMPSPSAAFHLVRGLRPDLFGVRIDPGGELFEGFEAWDYTVAILMDYLVGVTARDSILVRHPGAEDANSKGWARRWATVQDGMTDWAEMARQLRNIEFGGTIELAPMVSTRPEQIRAEADFLKNLFAEQHTAQEK